MISKRGSGGTRKLGPPYLVFPGCQIPIDLRLFPWVSFGDFLHRLRRNKGSPGSRCNDPKCKRSPKKHRAMPTRLPVREVVSVFAALVSAWE